MQVPCTKRTEGECICVRESFIRNLYEFAVRISILSEQDYQTKNEPTISRKKFLQSIAAAGAAGAAGLALSESVIRPVHATVADADTASYVIKNESGTINAYSGDTGQVAFTGTDAAAVIQNAVNALPMAGGIIFLREGTYPITAAAQASIGLPSGVVVQGAGVDTTTIIAPQGFFYGIYPGTPTPSSQVYNIAIRDLTLQSNAPSGGAIGTGGYFFIASYGANALRFERLKMLGGGNVGTGVFEFPGTGGPSGNYSNIQFIDLWADTQGTTSGNEFFDFSNYNVSNIKFKRCYIKNAGGPTVGFGVNSASNVALRDCTIDSGPPYMVVFNSSLPITSRIAFDHCYFVNDAQFSTQSPAFQWIEVYFRSCVSERAFGVGGSGVYQVYLSDSWVLGTNSTTTSGYVSNTGNITIRGGGLVDGWNTSNLAWYNGGSAISIPTGQQVLAQANKPLVLDISGFRIGIPASGTTPGGILIPYSTTQNLQIKVVASFMPSSLISWLANTPGGNFPGSGVNWLNQLVNTTYMPKQHTLIGFTDESGNRYAYPQGIAPITTPPSGSPYTNNDGVPEAIYIVGGTISHVKKNSTNLFTTTNVTVWLEPGESVTITYSSAPSMFRDRK